MTDLKSLMVFDCPDGTQVPLRAVSTARIRASETKIINTLREQGALIEAPSYVPVIPHAAPGVVAKPVLYDASSIHEADEGTQAQYTAWVAQQDLIAQLTTGQMLAVLILRGTKFILPEDDTWKKEHAEDGLVVPEDKDELYVHYLLNEVLVPPSVAEACAIRIMRLSLDGMPREVISAFEDSFQSETWNGYSGQSKEDAKEGGVVI